VKLSKNIFAKDNQYHAGSLEERKNDFLEAVSDKYTKFIWTSIGGYSSIDILDFFVTKILPKIKGNKITLIGYSDISYFQNILSANNIPSLHGPTSHLLPNLNKISLENIRNALESKFSNLILNSEFDLKNSISATSIFTNLSVFTDAFGSKYDLLANLDKPIILGVEETDLDECEIRRNIQKITSHLNFQLIKAIIVGRLTNIKSDDYPNWSKKKSLKYLFTHHIFDKSNVPVFFNNEWGHSARKNCINFITLPNLSKCRIMRNESQILLKFIN